MATSKIAVGLTGLFVLFLVVASVVSIYKEGVNMIPGLAPTPYKKSDVVPLFVNKVTSIHTPIPYRYHDLPVCVPENGEKKNENLGEVITGNRIESSNYQLHFLDKTECEKLCYKTLNQEDVDELKSLIDDEYSVQWQVDGLPAAVLVGTSKQSDKPVYDTGFPLGVKQDSGAFVFNNHVRIIIHYNEHQLTEAEKESGSGSGPAQYNVVLFEIQPLSINYPNPSEWSKTCTSALSGGGANPLILDKGEKNVVFTYSVNWIHSDTNWATRWHNYLSLQGEGQIHWFSIINSLMIVFFLSGMVAMIMARTVRRDFIKYTEEEHDEIEETGWKLVHGDVFRPPTNKMLFSVMVGSGIQVFFMCVITMVFAVLGFLSPSNQGSIITAVLVLYVWMGVAAGYTSGRIYLTFEGEHRTRNTLLTALLFPGILFGIAFFLNFFLWYKGSSGALPFTTILAVMALWFGISLPLCYLGSRLAVRKEAPKHPGIVNHIPRLIPAQKWYMHPIASILMGGILPFGAVFIELFFIMSSIWLHRYYFLFGFLLLVFLILVITCAEISIVMCYFQLCAEDWHWWWRSFMTPGASAFYMFLYAIFYYVTRLEVEGFIPSLLYFGYSAILCLFFFVLTGTIGFYSCYWFVKTIYRAIHQD
eukprot:TRINITY_DN11990_c0_g1_i1.p1 TRINITY_DN11990_c0_g1~~TRINITY_DN11990_c0_g1_i1.p1  ORF type:complete len:659 (-),score=148.07 TRINITY_DN11990_c0_g1_i1:105-2039(-)